MKAMTNLKRGINTARARWNATWHALNRKSVFVGHSNPVRAGRALVECDFERFERRTQPRGGGCNVRLQPRFLGIADR